VECRSEAETELENTIYDVATSTAVTKRTANATEVCSDDGLFVSAAVSSLQRLAGFPVFDPRV
jgi:hypothetical protein